MNMHRISKTVCLLAAFSFVLPSAMAARKSAPATPLSAAGSQLEGKYANQLKTLKEEITKALPGINEQKKSAYLKAREVEKAAKAEVKAAQERLGEMAKGNALVNHAKGKWIGGADKGIAAAKAKLKNLSVQ